MTSDAGDAPPTVGDVLAAEATLRPLDRLRGEEHAAYRRAHEAELLAATSVLERMLLVQRAILETHHAAEAEYGIAVLCNLDEERIPPFDVLAAEFVADAARRAGQPEDAVRDGLLQVEVQEMLPRRFMRHFQCPGHVARVIAPGSPPPAPATPAGQPP